MGWLNTIQQDRHSCGWESICDFVVSGGLCPLQDCDYVEPCDSMRNSHLVCLHVPVQMFLYRGTMESHMYNLGGMERIGFVKKDVLKVSLTRSNVSVLLPTAMLVLSTALLCTHQRPHSIPHAHTHTHTPLSSNLQNNSHISQRSHMCFYIVMHRQSYSYMSF